MGRADENTQLWPGDRGSRALRYSAPRRSSPMFASLPTPLRVPLAMLLLAANTVAHVAVLFALTLVKLVLPWRGARVALSRALVAIAESWIGVNGVLFDLFTRTRWRI